MAQEIKKEEGIITKVGTFKKDRKPVPERVALRRQEYLNAKTTQLKNK